MTILGPHNRMSANIFESNPIQIYPAELLDIKNTPVILLPAPGDGYVYDIIYASAQYKFGSIPYAFDAGSHLLTVQYQNDPINLFGGFDQAGFIDQVQDCFWPTSGFFGFQGNGSNLKSACNNIPVTLTSTGPAPTLGNGSIFIHLLYKIIKLQ